MSRYTTVFFLIFISFVRCQFQLPPGFEVCRQSDPDLNECLIKAIQTALLVLKNGEPSLNFPPIQPLKYPKWTVPPSDLINFEQRYTNLELYNIPNYKINRVQTTITDTTANFIIESFNPEFIFEADYEFENAVLLGESLSGKGRAKYIHDDYETDLNITGELIAKGSSRYLTITDFQFYRHTQKVLFEMETGDPEQNEKLKKLGNSNWLHIFLDTNINYTEMYSVFYKSLVDAVFSSVPFDVLFPK